MPPHGKIILTPSEVFVARITRKELKTDKFALEVEHTVDFFEEHRKDIIRYGAVAVVVVLIGAGHLFLPAQQRSVAPAGAGHRRSRCWKRPPVTAAAIAAGLTFPTPEARDKEAVKRFSEVASKYSGSDEGRYRPLHPGLRWRPTRDAWPRPKRASRTWWIPAARTTPRWPGCRWRTSTFSSGRTAQGEEVLRPLIDKPTVLVSKDEATIALARGLAESKPAEARKLLEPLRASRSSAVSQAAIQLYSEIPQ